MSVQQSLLAAIPQAGSFVEVAVPVPAPGGFTYAVPAPLAPSIRVGHAVAVPFGPRQLVGVVLARVERPPDGVRIKPLSHIAIAEPLFGEELVPLLRWIARYYAHPLGEVARTALPAATRASTRTVVELQDKGLQAVQGQRAVDPAMLPMLERLARATHRSLAHKTLIRKEDVPEPLLRAAEREGLVAVVRTELGAVAQERTEAYVSLRASALKVRGDFERPGPVRDRVIDYIERFQPVAMTELREAFPSCAAPLRALTERDLLTVEERRVSSAADLAPIDPADRLPRPPTPSQIIALQAITAAIAKRDYAAFLLLGVTGSGKTEVYLQAASQVLDAGGGAILLVPEIGLTPQFLARFRARFGETTVGVLHSGLTDRERFDEWMRIQRGEARLVVGPRSAVFAPVRDLRLIVVDEEHDGSYKQDDGLRYHARDVALVRAQKAGAVCVLGSATPALETMHNVRQGRVTALRMPSRVTGRSLPRVEVVDLREHPVADPDAPGAVLSPPLRDALVANHEDGGQAILLLNRRGFATTLLCTSCGEHQRCPDCDVSMTFHARRHAVLCHWCGRQQPVPESCPSCGKPDTLKAVGRGTERLEEEMLALWPDLRLDRMDADTTSSRDAHRRILDRFRRGEVDVLIGTQMVAKGHDFPGVTLVGVLHADAALHLPDFRAAERTYQLVSQVAGRAGRGERPGRVLVQTWHPGHHAIRLALDHDFDGFAERELRLRKGLWYPPWARLCLFGVSALDERRGGQAAAAVRDALEAAAAPLVTGPGQLRVLGPSPAPMYRIRGRFRWQVLVKAQHPNLLGRLLDGADALRKAASDRGGDSKLSIDRDPVSLL